ncbi:hypothetical protein KACC15558_30640 [Brevibacterium ammoniilyticum]|uniref:Uncharacterized protein n=1 Tax=Brevibacterium ammoniilyticum TaxID=1046555 RepID=A0ABP9U6Y5_9MICO
MPPGLGAIIFLTLAIIVVFTIGFFLVYTVMTKPGMHIGSRLPKHDPDSDPGPRPDRDPRDDPDEGPDQDDGDDHLGGDPKR